MDLVENILRGDAFAASRSISLIEREDPRATPILKALYPHTGKSLVVGVTGGGGAGKSTLISALTAVFRRRTIRVGILAMDPSSPISGGALLGDRIRMQEHFLDSGVFIRSAATRGRSVRCGFSLQPVLHVFEALGCGLILVETVGVGQNEFDVAPEVHLLVLVVTPDMGDDIQTLKAGILEIGDLIVVNKGDHPGADETVHRLKEALKEGTVILKASAEKKEGIEALADAIFKKREALSVSGEWARRQRNLVESELKGLLRSERLSRSIETVSPRDWEKLVERVVRRKRDPYRAVREITNRVFKE